MRTFDLLILRIDANSLAASLDAIVCPLLAQKRYNTDLSRHDGDLYDELVYRRKYSRAIRHHTASDERK